MLTFYSFFIKLQFSKLYFVSLYIVVFFLQFVVFTRICPFHGVVSHPHHHYSVFLGLSFENHNVVFSVAVDELPVIPFYSLLFKSFNPNPISITLALDPKKSITFFFFFGIIRIYSYICKTSGKIAKPFKYQTHHAKACF